MKQNPRSVSQELCYFSTGFRIREVTKPFEKQGPVLYSEGPQLPSPSTAFPSLHRSIHSQGPEEMCLSLEHQNPSETFEKNGLF